MSKTLHAALGSGSADPFGVVPPGSRVLALTAPDVSRWADGVFAVVDASDETAAHVSRRLERIFKRKSAPEGLVTGQEDTFLSETLDRLLSVLGEDGDQVAVAVAIWHDRELVLGSLEGASALLCHAGAVLSSASLPRSGPDHSRIQVSRVSVEVGDCLVLASPGVTQAVSDELLVRTLSAPVSEDVSIDAAATWLVTLTSDRRHRLSSVLLARFDATATTSRAVTGSGRRRRGFAALRRGGPADLPGEEARSGAARPDGLEAAQEYSASLGTPFDEVYVGEAPAAGRPQPAVDDVLETIPFPTDFGYPEDVAAHEGTAEEKGETDHAPPHGETPRGLPTGSKTDSGEEAPDDTLLLERGFELPVTHDTSFGGPVAGQAEQEPPPVRWPGDAEPDPGETLVLPSARSDVRVPAESTTGDSDQTLWEWVPPGSTDREPLDEPPEAERGQTERVQLKPESPELPAAEVGPAMPPLEAPLAEASDAAEEEAETHDPEDTVRLLPHEPPQPIPMGSGEPHDAVSSTVQLPTRPDVAAQSDDGDTQTPGAPSEDVPAITGSEVQTDEGAAAVVLVGTAAPGCTIEISDWTVPVGTTEAGPDGAWKLTLLSVSGGTHTYRAKAIAADGSSLGTSPHHSLSVDVKDAADSAAPGEAEPSPARAPGRISPALVGLVGTVGGIAALIALAFFALRSGSGKSHISYRSTPPVVAVGTTPGPKPATPTPHRAAVARPTSQTAKAPAVLPPRPTVTPTRVRPTVQPRAIVSPTVGSRATFSRTATPVGARRPLAVKATIRPTPPRVKAVVPRPRAASTRAPTKVRSLPTARPGPARSWDFPGLTSPPQQVILTVSNQNSGTVDVYLRQGSQVQHVRIPGQSGAELELTAGEATRALSITASAPVLAARLLIGPRQAVQVGYGTPNRTAP